MADPRLAPKLDNLFSDDFTMIIDNSTITYSETAADGSASVGLAVTLSGNSTVALAAADEVVRRPGQQSQRQGRIGERLIIVALVEASRQRVGPLTCDRPTIQLHLATRRREAPIGERHTLDGQRQRTFRLQAS